MVVPLRRDEYFAMPIVEVGRLPGFDDHRQGLVDLALRLRDRDGGDAEGTTPWLQNMWVNVLGPGGYNAPHAHTTSRWAGVFYVDVENARSGTGPHDYDGSICFHNPNQSTVPFGAHTQHRILPKDGTMMLFPGSLLHTVFPHQNDVLRISIAFNADVRPKGVR